MLGSPRVAAQLATSQEELHAFLTSALDGDEQSASRPGHFTSGPLHGTKCMGPIVGVHAAALDVHFPLSTKFGKYSKPIVTNLT
jgi:hypothetical protein